MNARDLIIAIAAYLFAAGIIGYWTIVLARTAWYCYRPRAVRIVLRPRVHADVRTRHYQARLRLVPKTDTGLEDLNA